MRVYVANFGVGNWAWPECLRRSSIAVMDDDRVHGFWKNGDRLGYIAEANKVLKLSTGHQGLRMKYRAKFAVGST
jgi:hypothetical protein